MIARSLVLLPVSVSWITAGIMLSAYIGVMPYVTQAELVEIVPDLRAMAIAEVSCSTEQAGRPICCDGGEMPDAGTGHDAARIRNLGTTPLDQRAWGNHRRVVPASTSAVSGDLSGGRRRPCACRP